MPKRGGFFFVLKIPTLQALGFLVKIYLQRIGLLKHCWAGAVGFIRTCCTALGQECFFYFMHKDLQQLEIQAVEDFTKFFAAFLVAEAAIAKVTRVEKTRLRGNSGSRSKTSH